VRCQKRQELAIGRQLNNFLVEGWSWCVVRAVGWNDETILCGRIEIQIKKQQQRAFNAGRFRSYNFLTWSVETNVV